MPSDTALLERVIAGEDLAAVEVEALFGRLMDGRLNEPFKAGLLAALATKGETAAEIAGAAAAMRGRVLAVPHNRADAVDTCGTGGDGKGTFNISTAAALVAAAAGVPVAKHGNRAVSSRSGSADLLAALGVNVELSAAAAGRSLDEIGIAFLFAPGLHPAMREVVPVRRGLGVRTIFNVLGPLTNPAGARRQLLGVYSDALVPVVARVLADLGSDHALVVHGSDGLDEITTTGPTHAALARGGVVEERTLRPEEYGVAVARPDDLGGGDPEDNAKSLTALFAGERGPLRDITVLNAGAAIWVGGRADDIGAGVELAAAALDSGAARRKLAELVAFSQGAG